MTMMVVVVMMMMSRMVIIKPASKSYLSQNVNASSERCLSMNRISKPLQRKKICDLSTLNILENTLKNILDILNIWKIIRKYLEEESYGLAEYEDKNKSQQNKTSF